VDLLWRGLLDAFLLIVRGDFELLRIAGLSLAISGSATLIAAALGVPLGAALRFGRLPARAVLVLIVNTGMGLPPVVVGLAVTIVLWRTGPLGSLALLYTPSAMVLAQLLVALPLVAGFTSSALGLLDPDLGAAMRVDGAGGARVGYELIIAAWPQVVVAVAAGFGRAIAEVGASLMVGGNIVGQTRILTTAITLETSRGDFALAIALGIVLLTLAFMVNAGLGLLGQHPRAQNEL
jgi:tungstate transport system permease protein